MIHVLYSRNTRESGCFGHEPDLKLDPSWYYHVCSLETDDPDVAWRMMNVVTGEPFEVPQKIRNRSMMVGDVLIVATPPDETGFVRHTVLVCAGAGWEKIDHGSKIGLAVFLVQRIALGAPCFVVPPGVQ